MTAHHFLIHFPVSLFLVGAALDVAGAAVSSREVRRWGGHLLIAGGVAAFLAFVTGEGARLALTASGEVDVAVLEAHQQWGSAGVWGLLVAALLRAMWRTRFGRPHGWINLGVAILAAALVVGITLSGTLVRHGG